MLNAPSSDLWADFRLDGLFCKTIFFLASFFLSLLIEITSVRSFLRLSIPTRGQLWLSILYEPTVDFAVLHSGLRLVFVLDFVCSFVCAANMFVGC